MGKRKEKISCFGCGFCKENPHGYICLHEDTEKSKEIYEKRTGKRIKKNCMWIGREPLERGLKHCPLKKENREVYERGKRMTEEECNELLRELYFVRGWLNSDREYCNFDNLVNAIDLQRIKLEKLVKEHFELEKRCERLEKANEKQANIIRESILTKKPCAWFIEEIRSYKFEDLRVGMWVYDSNPEYEDWTFIKITKILSKDDCERLYHDKNKQVFFDNMECHAREFEENRFFPVWVPDGR